MDKILVIGRLDDQTITTINYLSEKKYPITLLIPEKPEIDLSIPETVDIIIGNPNNITSISTIISENFKHIIYFANQLGQTTIDSQQSAQEISSLTEFTQKKSSSNTEKILFNFTNSNLDISDIWGAVNDGVMGGVSQSNIRLSNHRAIFSGIVSTDNNGGFASVRTRNLTVPWDLSQYEGIELKVVGDGKRYKFIARCAGQWDGIAYCASFDTVCNESRIIPIRFCDLIPVFRAKTVSEAGYFDSSQVYAIQLMLSKFEYDGQLNPNFAPGVFGLEVEYIKAYGNINQPQLTVVNCQSNSDYIDNQAIKSILRSSGFKNNNYSIINSHSLAKQLKNIF
ncbi:MAG: CIA30 family protein [Xenococcus sp. (in: cyanobacteria)]